MVRRRAARIGVASMVRGDHQHVGETQQRQELRKQAVKFFQRSCKSLNIFPVAVQHVEIHQVAKNEPAFALADCYRQFFHAVGVALRGHVFFDSAAVVNVMNLADTKHANFTLRENIHQHRLRRVHRIIMPPRRPNIVSRHSREGPRDHASHAVRPIQQFAGDLAHMVELGNWNHLFMRGDLKHAVARRVHNRLTRSHMFFAQFLDDLRTGSRLVSDRFPSDLFLKLLDQLPWESVSVNRKRLVQPHPTHFPMSSRRIFSRRACSSLAIRSKRSSGRRLLYSGTSRSLNYLPFACVVQDSGGVPWPRTAIPGEFRLSSRSSSLRSVLSFSSAIGIPASIPCLFSGPTGRSFSSLLVWERYGITYKEAAIPTHLRESPSAPLLARSHLSWC